MLFRLRRYWCACLWILLIGLQQTVVAQSDDSPKSKPKASASGKPSAKPSRTKPPKSGKKAAESELAAGIRNYSSENFLLHTDLPDDEANDLLERLESMLQLISTYWAKPNSRTIEMFVVKDPKIWPQALIAPRGWESINSGGGVTISQTMTRTDNLTGEKAIIASEAVVYAVAEHGTPLHEAVHAYCAQAFGRAGPTWYAEGMAEMGQYWKDKDSSVNCHEGVVQYLKSQEPKQLTEITNVADKTGDGWKNYAWRWALCHLLANNPNYAPRFRPLGLALLNDQKTSFEDVYGSMAKEISFEYVFFLKHFDRGYRADLCGWDWKTKCVPIRGNSTVMAKIDAAHGWQPSRLQVKEGTKYSFTTTGTWKVAKDGDELTAKGNVDGQGKLVGVLFEDYELSEPFDLGESSEWIAPADGKLYLRCQDGWCDLADNKGAITVKWKLAD